MIKEENVCVGWLHQVVQRDSHDCSLLCYGANKSLFMEFFNTTVPIQIQNWAIGWKKQYRPIEEYAVWIWWSKLKNLTKDDVNNVFSPFAVLPGLHNLIGKYDYIKII